MFSVYGLRTKLVWEKHLKKQSLYWLRLNQVQEEVSLFGPQSDLVPCNSEIYYQYNKTQSAEQNQGVISVMIYFNSNTE